jgi:hypothetical protein
MVRFNEEVMGDFTEQQRQLDHARDKASSLIQKIIRNLD